MSQIEQFGSTQATPEYTLHPIRGVVWAAFWGTILAAGIVIAINYSRVGKKSAAWYSIAIALASTVLLFVFIFAMPDSILDRIPNIIFIVPQLLAVQLVANGLQSEMIERHEADGGDIASAWPSVGIGLLCLPLVFGTLLGILALYDSSFGTRVAFGNDEIYYSGEATEEDARRLAESLKEMGYFGELGASVLLKSSEEQYTVSFVVLEGVWNDAESVEAFREVGELLTLDDFSRPLTVELCDEYFSAQKSILIE